MQRSALSVFVWWFKVGTRCLLFAGLAGAGVATAEPGLPDAPLPSLAAAAEDGQKAQSPDIPALAIPVDGPDNLPVRMDFADKSKYYLRHVVSPTYFVVSGAEAGYAIARPKKGYPVAWRKGGEAFGRNFGDHLARHYAGITSKYLVGAALGEDPRYYPSPKGGVGLRIAHALAFTVVDRSDSGHPRIAVSNFADAAAAGFVADAYLPKGFTDLTHAGQRGTLHFCEMGAANILHEFSPELGIFGTRVLSIFNIYR